MGRVHRVRVRMRRPSHPWRWVLLRGERVLLVVLLGRVCLWRVESWVLGLSHHLVVGGGCGAVRL